MTSQALNAPASESVSLWRDYLELCKPRVVALVCFTAIVGMLLATPGAVPWDILIAGNLGIFLAASSAAAINHVVDSRVDAMMRRTQDRPLPSGHIDSGRALAFAAVLGVSAMALLGGLVNALTAWLTFASLIGYAVVYTMFLKRATPQNIVIGGAAGAAPPVLGWTAVTGSLDPSALLLFGIIFAWTPPHFWALAIHRREEYAKAGIPMLPVTHGVAFTSLHALLYTVLLVVMTAMPYLMRSAGPAYLMSALVLGSAFLHLAWRLHRRQDGETAMAMFRYSVVYLMLLFSALLTDHYIAL